MTDYFERYRNLIEDWAGFVAAVQRPLPTTIWANPLKVTPEQLQHLMSAEGVDLAPVPWYPGAFRLPADVMPGLRWEFMAGLYQVQEEVALLPARLLDPQPGERVLDMCAAPGNKTAQMGAMMANRGTLLANDRNGGRMRAARDVLNRIGLVNVTTLTWDGSSLPGEIGQFDKIMVDVPCTCEGTCRKDRSVLGRSSVNASLKMARLQTALLRKAVQLCRPGGRIVYATCTFAPEENELVVDAILRESGDGLRLRPSTVPGLVASAGLTEWQGQSLHPDLHHASRIWPQQNDTGGFFVAVLEKVGGERYSVGGNRFFEPGDYEPEENNSVIPNKDTSGSFKAIQRQVSTDFISESPLSPGFDEVTERFGLDTAVFHNLTTIPWSKRGTYLVNRDQQLPTRPRLDAPGLFFMRTGQRYAKMTTAAAMLLGQHATQNRIDLTSEQARAYLQRHTFAVEPAQTLACTDTGYVVVCYLGYPLGLAIFHTLSGEVESHFPKAWVRTDVQL